MKSQSDAAPKLLHGNPFTIGHAAHNIVVCVSLPTLRAMGVAAALTGGASNGGERVCLVVAHVHLLDKRLERRRCRAVLRLQWGQGFKLGQSILQDGCHTIGTGPEPHKKFMVRARLTPCWPGPGGGHMSPPKYFSDTPCKLE
jgi:hypothetical protein